MIAPARVAAYEILTAVSAGSADLPAAIASSRAGLHDDRDRALAAEIATGVQRWRAALDHLIAAFSKRPLARLDPEIVEILRLSLYQLLHLTRVPASAVVDDAVKLVRRASKTSAAGFVNAVLREISRNRGSLPLPPRPLDPANREAALDYFSVTLSHPRWLAARWYDRLGFDAAEAWMRFDNTAGIVTLRANRLVLTREALADRLRSQDIETHPGAFAPDALIVDEGNPLRLDDPDRSFFVQDEASQLVSILAGPSPGPHVLDTCASPGGKTTALAASMHNRGSIVACDVRAARIRLLTRTIEATAATNVRVVQADVMQPLPFSQSFDCVLVDAPCSGLGTLRRDPDIRWRRTEDDLPSLAAAQRQMVRHAAACVGPGGRLIYATCSSEPDENDAVVDALLASEPSFAAVDARTIPGVPSTTVDDRGRLRTTPDQHGLECFFGAVLQRTH